MSSIFVNGNGVNCASAEGGVSSYYVKLCSPAIQQ